MFSFQNYQILTYNTFNLQKKIQNEAHSSLISLLYLVIYSGFSGTHTLRFFLMNHTQHKLIRVITVFFLRSAIYSELSVGFPKDLKTELFVKGNFFHIVQFSAIFSFFFKIIAKNFSVLRFSSMWMILKML